MVIKVGTLCWLVNMDDELAQYAGRVVEVVAPLALRSYTSILTPHTKSTTLSYIVNSPWLVSLAIAMGFTVRDGFCIAPHYLQPFSDPDSADADRVIEPFWKEAV